MEQHDPYQRPQSQVMDVIDDLQPASRWKRLGGAMVDSLIALAVLLPLMFMGGYFRNFGTATPGMATQLMWGVFGIVVIFAIQYLPLKTSGQTWGKKVVGTRIVDMQGDQPDIGVLLGKRYLFSAGIGLVPIVGNLIGLVNVLFVFRADRRCLHDLVADTRVVEAG